MESAAARGDEEEKKKTLSFIHPFSSHERDPPYICSVLAEAVPVILNVSAYLDDTPTSNDAHAEGTQSRWVVSMQLVLLLFGVDAVERHRKVLSSTP